MLPTLQTPVAPKTAPQPEPGTASVSGVLFSSTVSRVLTELLVYLTPGWGDDKRTVPGIVMGPRAEAGDIFGRTDGQGQFALNNIPPGNYYLVAHSGASTEFGSKDFLPSQPQLIELKAGDQVLLGVVYVALP
jgi:hypothetical protein